MNDIGTSLGHYLEEKKKWQAESSSISGLLGILARSCDSSAVIQSRLKSFLSTWAKMHRRGLSLDEVHDLRGFRVLVDTEDECYLLLHSICCIWSGRTKHLRDYVNNPKPNGYRALHVCISGVIGSCFEVQICTREMHHNNEFGSASHQTYKQQPWSSYRMASAAISN